MIVQDLSLGACGGGRRPSGFDCLTDHTKQDRATKQRRRRYQQIEDLQQYAPHRDFARRGDPRKKRVGEPTHLNNLGLMSVGCWLTAVAKDTDAGVVAYLESSEMLVRKF